ncbi:hypothetical protein [Streptomyces sp. NPDC003393]
MSWADDPRVSSRLDAGWMTTLRSSFGRYPQGKLSDVLDTVKALHDTGVDVLVGTDASVPLRCGPALAVVNGGPVGHEAPTGR